VVGGATRIAGHDLERNARSHRVEHAASWRASSDINIAGGNRRRDIGRHLERHKLDINALFCEVALFDADIERGV
jgi:hypothetical protein